MRLIAHEELYQENKISLFASKINDHLGGKQLSASNFLLRIFENYINDTTTLTNDDSLLLLIEEIGFCKKIAGFCTYNCNTLFHFIKYALHFYKNYYNIYAHHKDHYCSSFCSRGKSFFSFSLLVVSAPVWDNGTS